MYRKSFPECKISGDLSPVPFGHMISKGSIPKKCSQCDFSFEGECTRGKEIIDGFLNLDFGPCGIKGSSEPVLIEKTKNGNEIFVPNKCTSCEFLTQDDIRGYICKKDNIIWGDFPRDLDWGDWKPDYPLIGLSRYKNQKNSRYYLGQAIITKELVLLLQQNELVKAFKLYRKLNKVETIKEAREDIEKLERKLNHKEK